MRKENVDMQALKDKIRKDGKVFEGNVLKVDSFVNHQIDVGFMCEVGKEFHRRFADCKVDKILTIEASGIGIACLTAQYFNVPVVFAKKSRSINISGDVYTAQVESFTHKNINTVIVSKDFLHAGEKVLIIDDFLARGSALTGLIKLIRDAGAEVVGAGIVIEKAFQDGHDLITGMGVRVESLARIKSMSVENGIEFID